MNGTESSENSRPSPIDIFFPMMFFGLTGALLFGVFGAAIGGTLGAAIGGIVGKRDKNLSKTD